MSKLSPPARIWATLLVVVSGLGLPHFLRADDAASPAKADATTNSQKYDLKYKFKPGEVLTTEVVHRASVRTTIQGTTQTAETQSKSIKSWKVEGVDETGAATFTHVVDDIEMWQRNSGRQEVRYNSQSDEAVPPGYEEVAKSVGVPLSVVTMDPRGTILSRKETRAQPMGVSTQMTMPLADHPIAIGESWSMPIDIDVTLTDGSMKKVKTRQKFTLESVEEGIAKVKVDSQVLTPIHDPSIEAQLVQRMSDGWVKFDIANGRVLSQQLDLDKHVIGFNGPTSSMHYVTRFTERLLDESEVNAATAKRGDSKKRS